jgi:hypothetical protein
VSDNKHTAGPWRTTENSDSLSSGNFTVWHEGQMLATVWNHHGKNADANARLIVAAPRMLEALEAWEVFDKDDSRGVDGGLYLYDKAVQLTRIALAAARSDTEEAA